MNTKIQTILGISLGTRTIGYAILREKQLYDWGIKSFRDKWSVNKLHKIIRVIERIITENDINYVSIKVPKEYQSHQTLHDLHSNLCNSFLEHSIAVYTSSLNNLKLWYTIDERHPKSCLQEFIAYHYPILCKRSDLSVAGQKYYMKIYEALAAAEMSQFLK